VPRRLRRAGLTALGAFLALAAPAPAKDDGTVTISGRAYAFNHMDTYLQGATIRVRELPRLSATTNANGDYVLEVPDGANVTPYIEPPDGYNQIDLQTFHTRGKDIENANFQTPADLEYNALAVILGVPIGPDGRPAQCVIVTTASARNVRGVPYETFHERTPHGVAGATAGALPETPGPTYFNEFVIPDRSETATSEDGGIIWTEVPAGTYRIYALHPETRFASFLATCENGRIVNANPPWGTYELAPGERALRASIVASSVRNARVRGSGEDRRVAVTLDSGEAIRVRAGLRQGGKRIGGTRVDVGPGVERVTIPVRRADVGAATVRVKLRDAAANKVVETAKVSLPAA
jgi:hypothetical protein